MTRISLESRPAVLRLLHGCVSFARSRRFGRASAIFIACCLVPLAATAQAPHAPSANPAIIRTPPPVHRQPQSEIVLEGLRSFGHFHMFAYSWWSMITTAGVEYDRHTWGRFAGAQMDYVAEFLPVIVLNQPGKTDAFGDPLGNSRQINRGIGIEPIGLRMMWFSNREVKPYLIMKGGLFAFTHKALSHNASYLNFDLQMGLGAEFHIHRRLGFRVGFSDLHFSDAFMVPSNPGLDSMSITEGICYHFGGPRRSAVY